jgi:4-alpha-glucanotransferase
MLPIGEDLGTVPMEVRSSLQRLGICGTKVIRWERSWDKPNKPYIPYKLYNGDSMTTVSTHDSDTLEQWWTDLQEESKSFCEFKCKKILRKFLIFFFSMAI